MSASFLVSDSSLVGDREAGSSFPCIILTSGSWIRALCNSLITFPQLTAWPFSSTLSLFNYTQPRKVSRNVRSGAKGTAKCPIRSAEMEISILNTVSRSRHLSGKNTGPLTGFEKQTKREASISAEWCTNVVCVCVCSSLCPFRPFFSSTFISRMSLVLPQVSSCWRKFLQPVIDSL